MRWNADTLKHRLSKLEALLEKEKDPERIKDLEQDINGLKGLIEYTTGGNKVITNYIPYEELDPRYDENLEFLQTEGSHIAFELHPFSNITKVPFKPLFTRKISMKRYINIVEEFLKEYDEELYRFYLKLKREQRIELNKRKYLTGFAKGETTPFLTTGRSYISTRFNGKLDMASTLPHEVIHAYELDGVQDRILLQKKVTSLFKETHAIYIEYVFFDYLQKTRYKKQGYREEGIQLDGVMATLEYLLSPLLSLSKSKYEAGYFKTKEGVYSSHYFSLLLSELLAIHFYNIYLHDKDEAKKLLKEFDSMLGTVPDEEIMKRFNIENIVNSTENVLKRYFRAYK